MRAYQCSKCENLSDCGEYVECSAGIDPRPNHREKGDAERCKRDFKPLKGKPWHEVFAWENGQY